MHRPFPIRVRPSKLIGALSSLYCSPGRINCSVMSSKLIYFCSQCKTKQPRGGVLGSIFAGYVPLASPKPYPIKVYSGANYRPHVRHVWANIPQIPTCQNLLTPEIPQMCDPILVTLLAPIKMQPHYSQSSRENATPSSGTPPLAIY